MTVPTIQKRFLQHFADVINVSRDLIDQVCMNVDYPESNTQYLLSDMEHNIAALIDQTNDPLSPFVNQNIQIERQALTQRAMRAFACVAERPSLLDSYVMPVNVYRTDYDCTLDGVTSKHYRLQAESKSPTHIRMFDTLLLVDHDKILVLGSAGGRVHFKPLANVTDKKHYMFGGNFVYSSDSRFEFERPVHVHDRSE